MSENKINTPGKFADMPVRVRSWVIIILIVSISLLTPLFTCLFVAGLSYLGMKEYYAMVPVNNKWLQGALYFNSILLLLISGSGQGKYPLFPLIIIGYTCVCLLLLSGRKITDFFYCRRVFIGVLINVVAIGHLAFIRQINYYWGYSFDTVTFFLLIVILTELNDVFQYMTGKLFGKTKILPRLSPNKTLEGFAGGMVLTSLLANGLGIYLFPEGNHLLYTIGGLVISVLGSCGDLCMSSIKRSAGVKDTGTLIPGHGGLLDRVDSLIFVAPVVYWTMLILL